MRLTPWSDPKTCSSAFMNRHFQESLYLVSSTRKLARSWVHTPTILVGVGNALSYLEEWRAQPLTQWLVLALSTMVVGLSVHLQDVKSSCNLWKATLMWHHNRSRSNLNNNTERLCIGVSLSVTTFSKIKANRMINLSSSVLRVEETSNCSLDRSLIANSLLPLVSARSQCHQDSNSSNRASNRKQRVWSREYWSQTFRRGSMPTQR